jgi:hypothetical protein
MVDQFGHVVAPTSGLATKRIADAADGLQDAGGWTAPLDVAPQPDDEVVDGARIGVLVHAPTFSRISLRGTGLPSCWTK